MLGNIGFSEFVLIAVAALVLFGPDKLPGIGRKLGRVVREFRSGTATFLSDITRDPEQRRTEGTPAAGSSAAAPERTDPAASHLAAASAQTIPAEAEAAAPAAKQAPKPRRAPDPRRLPE